MQTLLISGIVAGALGLATVIPVTAQPQCWPKLTVTDVHFSTIRLATWKRKWTATVLVDDTRCQENSSGWFKIVFTRLSEFGPDLDFRERLAWRAPSVEVAEDFAANEAVERYRMENITPCTCRH